MANQREPRHISEVMAEFLARSGLGRPQAARELEAVWREVVGPMLAECSRPVRIYRRKLEIVVAHSAAVQELNFQKREILQRLAQHWPEKPVRDLKFRVGPLG